MSDTPRAPMSDAELGRAIGAAICTLELPTLARIHRALREGRPAGVRVEADGRTVLFAIDGLFFRITLPPLQ